jgi:glutathione S-transferase
VARALRGAPISIRAHPITLYDYEHSSHARRIRLVLTELGFEWGTERVDVSRMAHEAPEYLTVNPAEEMPAIRQGERVLYDSVVIAEHLDGRYGHPGQTRLFPRAAWPLAQVRMWIALEAGTHKELRPLWWLHVVRPALVAQGLDAESATGVVPAGVHPSHVSWLHDVLAGTPRFDSSPELARRRILQKLDVLGTDRHPGPLRWSDRVAARPAVAGMQTRAGRERSASPRRTKRSGYELPRAPTA